MTTSKTWCFSQNKPRSKGKAAQHRVDPGAAVLLHQRRLEERIQVFEKEKGMQGRVMDKVHPGYTENLLSNK